MLKKTKQIRLPEEGSVARVLSGQKEIAAFLGVSTKTIQRHLKSIPVSKFGKKIMILESDLVKWIKKNMVKRQK